MGVHYWARRSCKGLCIPLMWKMLPRIIADEMYKYTQKEQLISDNQRAYRRGSCGAKYIKRLPETKR